MGGPAGSQIWLFSSNVATLLTLVILLVNFHRSNQKRISDNASEMQSIRDDIKKILELEKKFQCVDALSAKIELIYPIFMKFITEGNFSKNVK